MTHLQMKGRPRNRDMKARWKVFRWNQITRLMAMLDALPAPSESAYARKLQCRLEDLRDMR